MADVANSAETVTARVTDVAATRGRLDNLGAFQRSKAPEDAMGDPHRTCAPRCGRIYAVGGPVTGSCRSGAERDREEHVYALLVLRLSHTAVEYYRTRPICKPDSHGRRRPEDRLPRSSDEHAGQGAEG